MKDSWAATAASTEIVPADEHRDSLLIQKTNATTVALGIGEPAVAGEGVQLVNAGDAAHLNGCRALCDLCHRRRWLGDISRRRYCRDSRSACRCVIKVSTAG